MQILSSKKNVQNSHKNRFWEGLGPHLGGVWGSLGCLLCTLRRFLNVSLVFEIALFSGIGLRWGPRGLLARFRVDFERFCEGFWWALERFRKEFRRIWDLMNR